MAIAPSIQRVTIDPAICHGEACIKGTRIMVSVLLDCLAAGRTRRQIIAEYPQLKEQDIRAAIAYGAALAHEQVLPLKTRRV